MRDLDAHAHETPGRAFFEFFERFFVEVLRVGVQAGHHASNGLGDELFLVHRLHIIAFDHAEHSCKLLQLFKRQRGQRAAGNGLQ